MSEKPFTTDDFIEGTPFWYSGHFQKMHGATIKYGADKIEFTDSAGEVKSWPVTVFRDVGFLVFTKGYGKISVFFSECSIDKPKNNINELNKKRHNRPAR